MKSWKTTLAGILGAVATYLATSPDLAPWLHSLGQFLAPVSVALIGFFAKDSNVTGGTVQQ